MRPHQHQMIDVAHVDMHATQHADRAGHGIELNRTVAKVPTLAKDLDEVAAAIVMRVKSWTTTPSIEFCEFTR